MIVWAVLNKQDKEYEQLLNSGYLVCDHTHKHCMPNEKYCENFKLSYNWMADKLHQYIKFWRHPIYFLKYRPDKLIYPRWVWYQINGCCTFKYNNKLFYSRSPGIYCVLTFDIDSTLILFSDYNLWHCCLNQSYIATSEQEDIERDKFFKQIGIDEIKIWDNKYINTLSEEYKKLIPRLQQETLKSWNLIFDVYNENEYIYLKNEDKTIQGVTWVLQKKDLIDVQEFLITQDEIDVYEKSFDEEM